MPQIKITYSAQKIAQNKSLVKLAKALYQPQGFFKNQLSLKTEVNSRHLAYRKLIKTFSFLNELVGKTKMLILLI